MVLLLRIALTRSSFRLSLERQPKLIQQQGLRLGSNISSVSFSTNSHNEDDDETSRRYPFLLDTTQPCQGRLVARILPRSLVDYHQKKLAAQCSVQEVRRLKEVISSSSSGSEIETQGPPTNHDLDYACRVFGSTKEEEPVVALTLDVTVLGSAIDPSSTQANKPVHLDLHMNRHAHEPAPRTLQRLDISMARRMQREKHQMMIRGQGNKRGVPRSKAEQKNKGSSCTSTLLVPNGDVTSQDDNDNDKDVSMDGYRTLNVSNLTSEALWKKLAAQAPSQEPAILSLSTVGGGGGGNVLAWLQVESCPPTIISVKTFDTFGSRLFVGVPLVISTEVLHATRAVVTWFADSTEVCRDSPCFTPTPDLVGQHLSVLIAPVRPGHDGRGHEEAYRFEHPVEPLPFMPLVSPLRDEWMERSQESFQTDLRVMTYNLLADLYTSREVDQQLMYNHCPPSLLLKNRRMPMLLYEILAFSPDLICLQEVDASVFESLLKPVLASQGYQGYYSNKASTQLEGCAMFWSLQCFEKADSQDQGTYCVRDLFGSEEEHDARNDDDDDNDEQRQPYPDEHNGSASWLASSGRPKQKLKPKSAYTKWDSMDSIDNLLCQHDELRRVTREKVGQVLQVATLALRREDNAHHDKEEKKKPKKLVVGNTHLFYHPMADHIRAMQAYVVCKQLDAVRHSPQQGDDDDDHDPALPPLVMCGDFNSNPLSGAVQVFLQRRLGADHFETWKHLNEYNWEMGDYEFMVEHGYVGNDANTGLEPTYLDEAFVDAREYEEEEEVKDATDDDKSSSDSSVSPPPIVLPSVFPTLFSGYQTMPEFTNLAVDFTETLDYILASEPSEKDPFGFAPKRSAEMPNEADVKKYVAMPNEFMPSDHVSLVCDLEWKKYVDVTTLGQ